MNISQQIGSRIDHLMKQHQVSLRSLSEVIGVSHPTLKRYVEGEQPIDSEKLMKVANYFKQPFEYFFIAMHQESTFMFRMDKPAQSVNGSLIHDLQERMGDYIDFVDGESFNFVPPSYHLPPGQLSPEVEKKIELIALEQRRLMAIDDIIPENYYAVIERLGIRVITRRFHHDYIFGISSYSSTLGSYIFINDDPSISEERKLFSLIHEYAHLLFHREQFSHQPEQAIYESSRSDVHEKVADLFAGYFLLPREMVHNFVNGNEHIDALEMKRYFKVSLQSLYVTLAKYKIISQNQLQQFYRQLTIHDKRRSEEQPLAHVPLQQKSSRLLNRLQTLFFDNQISTSKIGEVLGMDSSLVRDLILSWKQSRDYVLRVK